MKLKRDQSHIEVTISGKPFTTYCFDDTVAKPYLTALRTAAGIIVSRGFPIGNKVSPADEKTRSFEPHQRPLYFGHGNINGLNFWAEKVFQKYYGNSTPEAFGLMSLAKLEEMKQGVEVGTIRARFQLKSPSGHPIADELQSFSFRGDDRTRTIDCEFVVYATHGAVTFGDTKEGTFAIRLGPELSAPHDHMLSSSGTRGESAIWGKPANWVNFSGTVSGRPVGVVVFDSPKSFRHPTTWHARAYGLLAANPFGIREFTKDANRDGSWTVPSGKSLMFRYRVLIYDGDRSAAQLDELYRQYAIEP